MPQQLLTAYYFHGQDLCIVPRHVREDLEWMRDHGTDAVAVPVHEYQLDRAGALDVIRREADRVGLAVHIIASRWAGLIAGWPTAAGSFSATHPEAWFRDAAGEPVYKNICGGHVCSIYSPLTREFFLDAIDRLCTNHAFDGIVWDEIKCLYAHEVDHHPAALERYGRPPTPAENLTATAEFFGAVNARLREHRPGTVISTFIYSDPFDDATLAAIAGIPGQDYFGCDGKAWPASAKREGERSKTLVDQMPRFSAAAAQAGIGSMALIESQGLDEEQFERSLRHLPEFLSLDVDHVMYYYFGATPRASLEATHAFMEKFGPLLRDWRASTG